MQSTSASLDNLLANRLSIRLPWSIRYLCPRRYTLFQVLWLLQKRMAISQGVYVRVREVENSVIRKGSHFSAFARDETYRCGGHRTFKPLYCTESLVGIECNLSLEPLHTYKSAGSSSPESSCRASNATQGVCSLCSILESCCKHVGSSSSGCC
jgi:hypothetical protein